VPILISKFKEQTINGKISLQSKYQINSLIGLNQSDSVNLIIEEFYELHMLFHAYSFLFLRICSVFNPIFYGLFNSSFMFGYKNVLNIIFHCEKLKFKKKKTEPRKKIVIVYRRRKNVDVV
jgi:hypothetical protein